MKLEFYQINAFTDEIFGGNPACIILLEEWLPDKLLKKIAAENAVPETAFIIMNDDEILLRWFTPEIEMDLCGHATLATAHCLKTMLGYNRNEIIFNTLSGELNVVIEDNLYHMNFPSRMPIVSELPEIIKESFNILPKAIYKSRDYLLVFESENQVQKLKVDRQKFDEINLDPGGVIVTAKGSDCDFVSRFFTPQASILEDPVTGSAHCSLIPFWADRLGKNNLFAKQISDRLGILYCQNLNDRVVISGKAISYAKGFLWTE